MMRPSFGLLAGIGLATLGLACGSEQPGESGPGTGNTAGNGSGSGAGGTSNGPPTVDGSDSPLNGPRPPPGTALPPIDNYADPLDGFRVGLVPIDENFSGHPECAADCQDFPLEPIFEFGVADNIVAIFDQPAQAGGPCITEPQDGAIFPANWTRPRVNFSGGGQQHQLIFHADREANDLVVYTAQNPWIMPQEIWDGLRKNVYEEDITLTVRSSTGGGAPRESTSRFRIAPVQAGGSIVFWASRSQTPGLDASGVDTTQLLGFTPGDEAVISTLLPSQVQGTIMDETPVPKRVQFNVEAGQVRCVGCHTSTPDGEAVTITDHWPWNNKLASIGGDDVGGRPEYLTDVGDLLLQMPWQGTTTFSTGDWATGARRVITSYEGRPITRANFVPDAPRPTYCKRM